MSDPSNPSRGSSEQKAGDGMKIRKRAEAEAAPAPEAAPAAPLIEEPEPQAAPVRAQGPMLGRRVVDPSTIPARPPRTSKPVITTTFEDAGATTDDFAALFEGATAEKDPGAAPERRRFEPGDRVTAPVVHVDTKYIYVDLGGRGEARAPIGQYTDEEGGLEVEIGQSYEFTVLRLSREGIEVGKQLEIRQAGIEALEDAMAANLPLTGRVTGKNKGGLVVSIAGIDAFCPISQIDARYVEDVDVYLNQTFSFSRHRRARRWPLGRRLSGGAPAPGVGAQEDRDDEDARAGRDDARRRALDRGVRRVRRSRRDRRARARLRAQLG